MRPYHTPSTTLPPPSANSAGPNQADAIATDLFHLFHFHFPKKSYRIVAGGGYGNFQSASSRCIRGEFAESDLEDGNEDGDENGDENGDGLQCLVLVPPAPSLPSFPPDSFYTSLKGIRRNAETQKCRNVEYHPTVKFVHESSMTTALTSGLGQNSRRTKT